MASLETYTRFFKAGSRVRELHDFSIHSYKHEYEAVTEAIREGVASPDETIRLRTDLGTKEYRRDAIAHRARDVYPALLRSILLVRMVSAHEVFLIDTVREISYRSTAPFKTDSIIEVQQRQLLTLSERQQATNFVIERIARKLSSQGLNEIRKFYEKHLNIQIVPTAFPVRDLEEVYDRRHLFVHAEGTIDGICAKKYGRPPREVGQRVGLDEDYFYKALDKLNRSALHVKAEVERKFPPPPGWTTQVGKVLLTEKTEYVAHIEFVPTDVTSCSTFTEPTQKLGRTTLEKLAVWISSDGRAVRYLLAGRKKVVTEATQRLHDLRTLGEIQNIRVVKVLR